MKTINGAIFKEMLISGAANLSNQHQRIDSLNVFPVPDGDTGTNMSMTFSAGVKSAVDACTDQFAILAKTLSKGLLMGARGNSGVITSQIFRGFYQATTGKEEVDVNDLANAFKKGSEVAYKAVMRPVEGTILTVIRESSTDAMQYLNENPDITIEEYMDKLIEFAYVSLEHTPELLPVLKEVGVVDSGGAGLLVILEGFKAALEGNPFKLEENTGAVMTVASDIENGEFGYCTEFIIKLDDNGAAIFSEDKFKNALGKLGDSIVVVQDEELVKVHVHTLTPGDALNMGQRYGEFLKLKIENMQEQHNELQTSEATVNKVQEEKEYALIACVAGEGLKQLFTEYRCDEIISGGQTMNPSTEDFVEAIKKVNAKHIFLLPNNSNIILAAQQAAVVMDDLNIHVLTTKTIPEGLSACIMFNPEATIEDNLEEMNQAIAHVKTGQVTYAIKDTTFEGLEIKEGDYMGMFEKNIVSSNTDEYSVIVDLLKNMIDEDSELLTIICGENSTSEMVEKVSEYIQENTDLEIEVIEGTQPVYSYIFAVE